MLETVVNGGMGVPSRKREVYTSPDPIYEERTSTVRRVASLRPSRLPAPSACVRAVLPLGEDTRVGAAASEENEKLTEDELFAVWAARLW